MAMFSIGYIVGWQGACEKARYETSILKYKIISTQPNCSLIN